MKAAKLAEACSTMLEARELAWALIESLGHRTMVQLVQSSALNALNEPDLLKLAVEMKVLAESLEQALRREEV